MAKKPVKKVTKSTVKAKTSAKLSAKAPSKPVKSPNKNPDKNPGKAAGKTPAKTSPKESASEKKTVSKAPTKMPAKAPTKDAEKGAEKAKAANQKLEKAPAKKAVGEEKIQKSKKSVVPSVMGSKPKKDAGDLEDEFLDDDIEMDPELAEFADDVKELEEADAESEKIHAGAASREADGDEDDEEAATPAKKTPKEKSASERRIKKERDLLSGIDRNGDLSEIWQKFYETHKGEKAKPYSMRETFEAKSALQHVKLGWGFILSNINDRLEVLFKEGIKVLISNYKS